MKRWYSSSPCKGILLIAEHILVAVAAVCLVWTAAYPSGDITSVIAERPKESYADTSGFEDEVMNAAGSVLAVEGWTDELETDGTYDENKIVDIRQYVQNGTISGADENGLAYRLGDLVSWGNSNYSSSDTEYSDTTEADEEIIVCQKTDGTYEYFYAPEFREMAVSGEIIFGNLDTAESDYGISTPDEMVNSLIESWVSDENIYRNVLNSDMQQIYTSVWKYDGYRLDERFQPAGADSILDVANNNEYWNGRLSEAMQEVQTAADGLSGIVRNWQQVREIYGEGNTNLAYYFLDEDTGRVYTNRAAWQNGAESERSLAQLEEMGRYAIVMPKLAQFESNMDISAEDWRNLVQNASDTENFVFAVGVDTDWPIQDHFYQQSRIYESYAPTVRMVFLGGVLCTLAAFCILVWLTTVAGRSARKPEGEVALTFIDRLKTEIFLIPAGGLFVASLAAICSIIDTTFGRTYYDVSGSETDVILYVGDANYLPEISDMVMIGMGAAFVCASGLILWLGLVRRGKAGTLWKNSVTLWFLRAVRHVLSHIGIVWKTAGMFAVFILIHWITLAAWDNGFWFLLMVCTEAVAFFFLMRDVIGRHRIKQGVDAIASGKVDYQIPLEKLHGEQKDVAERINRIGDGLEQAVQESVKNERMKTDLITNVSHDIKTPLTSIINYVDLLKRENFEDPKIQNYLKVLEEKAQRLKTLTEDVVEASKVSSGNIKLEKINLNLVELVNQTGGEFEEKFQERGLELKLNLPGEPAVIYADGRRMWRVLSNIFNNAAKYAMTGSRVYADLFQDERSVFFTLKNVSEQPLNISADELTERFIRGDVSRSTEGSGLGLSIAKNLTELQGGQFELYLDGDLFKVMITFPRVQGTE